MKEILSVLATMTGIALGGYAVYFLLLGVYGVLKRSDWTAAAPQKRFALVVAARNEAAVIGHLVDSLHAQEYPRELFDVIVAPNNCTDNTAEVAKAHGARIFTPQGVIRSKGEVLTQLVDKLVLPDGYDAMCVFDADNLADAQFLQNMNNALCAGAQAVQGFRDSKNPRQSAMSGCYSICYWMLNRFYNMGRNAAGLSALVNGSGFAMTRDLLQRLGGWHTVTMTEDYEISAQCALIGERVHFCHTARIFDEQPTTFAESWKQRRRWTTGAVQGMRLYAGKLLEAGVRHKSAVCFDLFLTFLTPLTTLLGLASGGLCLAAAVPTRLTVLFGIVFTPTRFMLALLLVSAFAGLIGTVLAALVTVQLQHKSPRDMLKGICAFWIFLLSQTALTLLSFVREKTTWEPIVHTTAIPIQELHE